MDERLPDPPEWPRCREMAVPAVLRVPERPWVADLLPQEQRIRRRDRHCERKPGERATPVTRTPREERERRQQRNSGHAREDCETTCDPCSREAAALREHKGGEDEHQVQRL